MFGIIYDLILLQISKKIAKKIIKPYIVQPMFKSMKYAYNRYTMKKI
jgi:hypothetical protein